jgi:F0F1-type ATP synthase assembly protein I
MPFWIKLVSTVVLILSITEVSKKSEQLGALITALPWITLLSIVWLHMESQPSEKIASYSSYTFWYVLPTLPMFLIIPKLLGMGLNFWLALLIGIAATMLCILLLAPIALKFGLKLL